MNQPKQLLLCAGCGQEGCDCSDTKQIAYACAMCGKLYDTSLEAAQCPSNIVNDETDYSSGRQAGKALTDKQLEASVYPLMANVGKRDE